MTTSKNGTDWKKANDYMLKTKEIVLEDNSVIKPDRMERPFIYNENGNLKVLLLSVKKADESYIVFIPIKNDDVPKPK